MKRYLIIVAVVMILGIGGWFGYRYLAPAKLTIKTQPIGAKIFLDNQAVAPGEINVKRGSHTVRAQMTGYSNVLKKADLIGGQKEILSLNLLPLPQPKKLITSTTSLEMGNDQNSILLAGEDGRKFTKLTVADNKQLDISNVNFGQAIKVKWSPNRYLAYIWRENGTSGLVDLKRYDLVNQEFHLWGKGIVDLAWSPDGKEVAYAYKPGSGEFSLVRARANNEDRQRLYFNLDKEGITSPNLEWLPDGKELLVVDKDIYRFTFYTKQLKRLTQSGKIMWAQSSFDGKRFLASTDKKLFYIDLEGKNKELGRSAQLGIWVSDNGVVVFREGTISYIDIKNAKETKFAYLGEQLAKPEKILSFKQNASNDFPYLIMVIDKDIVKLTLQPETIENSLKVRF